MKKLSIFLLCSFAFHFSFAQIKIEKGNKFKKVTQTKSKMVFSIAGQPLENKNNTIVYDITSVENVNNNGYDFSSKIERMVIDSESQGQKNHIDSDKENDAQTKKILDPIIGSTTKIQTDKKGKIIKISIPQSADPMDMSGLMEGHYFPLTIPEGKNMQQLKQGDKWSTETKNNGVILTTSYKVVANDGSFVTIESFGDMITKKNITQNGIDVHMNIKSTFKAKSLYHKSNGILSQSTTTIKGSGFMEMMNTKNPIKMESTATIEMRKI